MRKKFTQGKWFINHVHDSRTIISRLGDQWVVVGQACGSCLINPSNYPPMDEGIANARLMSRAPELLEALLQARDMLASVTTQAEREKFLQSSWKVICRATGMPQ
jgi:hypothetical protein